MNSCLCRILLAPLCAFLIAQPALSYAKERKSEVFCSTGCPHKKHCPHKSSESVHDDKTEFFQHDIQLQLSDSNGFPVEGTKFWVTLDIIKDGPKVTVQFPVINFQTGPISADAPLPALVPGGYLYTADGFLPECIRPTDLVNRSIVAASNNGASETYSFAQDPATLPQPPAGYILQITNAGAVVVQSAGTFGNIIPPGPQILLPAEITYFIKPIKKLCKNHVISAGSTDTTQFTNSRAANDGFRDTHVIDAFDGKVAWAWADNSNISDKTNNTLNLMVATGKVDKHGKLKAGTPVQLTNLPAGVMVWDTAVTINRADKNNIVVSYGLLDHSVSPTVSTLCRAVSFDGGLTWPAAYNGITSQPFNGPLNIQPVNGFGDARGVTSDQFGNIWYGATEAGVDFTFRPIFYVSTDKGVTYKLIYTAPPVADPSNDSYDYPQYCFGGDGKGNYGINFTVTYFAGATISLFPVVGFIQINGANSWGPLPGTSGPLSTSQVPLAQLTQFTNSIVDPLNAASSDGRVWLQGLPNYFAASYISPELVLFKSPGDIDVNYAGPWNYAIFKDFLGYTSNVGLPSGEISQPRFGYINNSVQSIVYDNKRQALYLMFSQQSPDYSQNMRMPFIISRDNGQTWSKPIDINSTNFANRGFQSMALDVVTGNLVFGWYDGRNDATYQSVEYFSAVIPAKQLDCLVNSIPLSNPLFEVPPTVMDETQLNASSKQGKCVEAVAKRVRARRTR